MTPVLLYLLAITDWGFAGYRHAAGRDGRIFKGAYYRRAIAVALVCGHLPIALVGATVALLIATGSTEWDVLVAAAEPMVIVYATYATTVIAAFVPYLFGNTEIRTLATVSVFGPLTLIRPLLIVAGAVAVVWTTPSWPVGVAAATAVVSNGIAEPLLARVYPLPRREH